MELVGIRRTGVYNLGLAGKLETELGGIILVCKLDVELDELNRVACLYSNKYSSMCVTLASNWFSFNGNRRT